MQISTTHSSFDQYCISHKIVSHRAAAAPGPEVHRECPSSQQILTTPLCGRQKYGLFPFSRNNAQRLQQTTVVVARYGIARTVSTRWLGWCRKVVTLFTASIACTKHFATARFEYRESISVSVFCFWSRWVVYIVSHAAG